MPNKIKIPFDESKYDSLMKNDVEPFLSRTCEENTFSTSDGVKLYYRKYRHKNPSARVVICHGLAESCDKYLELIYIFLRAGCSVYIYDQRGHGKSKTRNELSAPTDVNAFFDYVDDLDDFVTTVVSKDDAETPLFLFAHSMGGATGALYLENFPDVFDAAVLSSPMFMPYTYDIPPILVRLFCGANMLVRRGDVRAFENRKTDKSDAVCEGADVSEARKNYWHAKRESDPAFANNGYSYRWVWEALGVKSRVLGQGMCEAITTPVLVFSAEKDVLVLEEPQQEFVARTAGGRLVKVKNAGHDIFNCSNAVFCDYIVQMLQFFSTQAEKFKNRRK